MPASVGLYTKALHQHPIDVAIEAFRRLEELGFETLWMPEADWREAFSTAALLLSATDRIGYGTNVVNINVRGPLVAANGQRALTEAFPGRFFLGMGVGHQRRHIPHLGYETSKPLTLMRDYLAGMRDAPHRSPDPVARTVTLLGGLNPKMIALGGSEADGIVPFDMTVEHTRRAREIVGPGPIIAPKLGVIFETDPGRARRLARATLANHIEFTNYRRAWSWLGYGDADFEGGGSDRLVDDVFAWGDDRTILSRIRVHLAAGATQVAVQVVTESSAELPFDLWERLASLVRHPAPAPHHVTGTLTGP